MKRRFNLMIIVIVLSSSLLFSSCIGSFSLVNKLLEWNKTAGDKYINELVFVALCLTPYPLALLADLLVLNSIEFWTGENPVVEGQIKTVKEEKGNYTIKTEKDGYHIEKEGSEEVVDLHFNKENRTWNLVSDGETTPLFQYQGNNQVVMYLPDGSTMPVELNEAGVLAFKQIVENRTYFAVNQ